MLAPSRPWSASRIYEMDPVIAGIIIFVMFLIVALFVLFIIEFFRKGTSSIVPRWLAIILKILFVIFLPIYLFIEPLLLFSVSHGGISCGPPEVLTSTVLLSQVPFAIMILSFLIVAQRHKKNTGKVFSKFLAVLLSLFLLTSMAIPFSWQHKVDTMKNPAGTGFQDHCI